MSAREWGIWFTNEAGEGNWATCDPMATEAEAQAKAHSLNTRTYVNYEARKLPAPAPAPTTPSLEKILGGLPSNVALVFGRTVTKEPEGDEEGRRVTAVFQFSEMGFGFGEIALVQTPEGVFLDTERMSTERVKRYITQLLDSAITDNDKDPARHTLYNRVMGRSCGPGCEVCHPK